MIKCKEIEQNASLYLDKELSVYKRALYKMHLMMCSKCSLFIAQFNAMLKKLSNLKYPKVDDEVSSIVEKLDCHINQGDSHEK